MFGKKEKSCSCCDPQLRGWKMLILGVLIVLNARYMLLDWWTFVGWAIGVNGLLILALTGGICKK